MLADRLALTAAQFAIGPLLICVAIVGILRDRLPLTIGAMVAFGFVVLVARGIRTRMGAERQEHQSVLELDH